MTGSAKDALIFIINAFVHLYVLVLILRLMLPWIRVPFNNPITQGILRVTSPLVVPIRRVLPPIGRTDTATFVVAYAIEYLLVLVIVLIKGWPLGIWPIAVTAVVRLVILGIWLFIIAIIIRVILSWTGGGGYNPATGIVNSLAEPVLRPVRRFIPPMGAIDFSAFAGIILLIALTILIGGLRMYPI